MTLPILVVGDVVVDQYYQCKVQKLASEWPCLQVNLDGAIFLAPGGAANVANNLAGLGADVILASIISNNENDVGTVILKSLLMTEQNILQYFIRAKNYPVPIKNRVMDHSGKQLFRWDVEELLQDYQINDVLTEKVLQLLDVQKFGCLVLSDYSKGALADPVNTQKLITKAKEKHILSIVDTKGRCLAKYGGADIVTITNTDLCDNLKITNVYNAAKQLLKSYQGQTKYLVVKMGADGMLFCLYDNDVYEYWHISAYSMPTAICAIGAGDTVLAVIANYLAGNLLETLPANLPPYNYKDRMTPANIYNMVRNASIAAGAVVGKQGTTQLTKEMFNDALVDVGAVLPDKVVQLDALVDKLETVNSLGSIGFVNGCFDMLHPGHVHLLQTAKARSDILVVAMNIDESIQRLKGYTRPIYKLEHRLKMLSALSCVDYIVLFNTEEELLDIIKKISPHYIFKGEDNMTTNIENIPGVKEIREYGGNIFFVPTFSRFSTTRLTEGNRII